MLKKIFLCWTVLFIYSQRDAMSQTQNPNNSGIHSLEQLTLGGVSQTILITGTDTLNHPILLLLHGGPGFSELQLFRSYNAPLDSSFTVVNWDQRGTGLSYSHILPPETISLNQLIQDGHELIGMLKKRFGKKKVFLAGHSWGSLLGISIAQRYPADIAAYIGIGQVVSMVDSEKRSLAYTIKMAKIDNNIAAMDELRPLLARYPSLDSAHLEDLFLERKWLSYYGGVVYQQRNYGKIMAKVSTQETKLYNDSLNARGEMLSMERLWPSLVNANLFKSIPKLKVPVFFIAGRHDYNTNFLLIEKYFSFLAAPYKELIWFERSAHVMPFEEPDKFNQLIKKIGEKLPEIK